MTDRQETTFDRALAAVLCVCAVLSLALFSQLHLFQNPAPMWVGLIWCVAITAPLALRRRAPGTVLLVIAAAFILGGELEVPEQLVANISLFLAMFTVGSWVENRSRAMLLRLAVIGAMVLWLTIALFRQTTDPDTLERFEGAGALSPLVAFMLVQILTNALYFGGAYFLGNQSWKARVAQRELDARRRELDTQRELTEHQAVELERLRIARELHDVVAHHVSLMGIQAAAARLNLERDPAQAAASLAGVEQNARGAIDELRGLLGTLRDPHPSADAGALGAGPRGASGGPSPSAGESSPASTLGLATLPALASENTAAGLPTRLEIVGEARPVPDLIGFTAYRVAQESLTNARKHGGATATADVRVRYLPEGIELEVGNSGSMPLPARPGALGHRGISERVAASGGTVELGPKPRGGYLVRVFLPAPAPSATGTAAPDSPAPGSSLPGTPTPGATPAGPAIPLPRSTP